MSQKSQKPRSNQGPTVRRTPVQKNPASSDRAPQPDDKPGQASPRQSAARQGGPEPGPGLARQRQVKPHEYEPRQGQYRQTQYREAVPRRDPFPMVIGGITGAILVGLVFIVLLLGGNNAPSGGAVSTGGNITGTTAPIVSNATTQATSPTIQVQPNNLPGTPVPEEGTSHVAYREVITYKNYPPSSGTHYGSTGEYGFSDKEIPEGNLVHNLEHGAIVLYYKPDLPADVLESLRQTYTSLPLSKHGKVKLVITPYSKLQTPMAIAAWTRVEPLTEFNFPQIQAFYQALVDKGPEDVP